MEPVSYCWTTGLHEPEPPMEGDTSTDVAIIGGGFTGLSTAYHLKELEPSIEVLVLEQDEVGYGPSGRNGGFGMTLFGMSMQVARLRFGEQRVKEAHPWPIESLGFGSAALIREGLRWQDAWFEHRGDVPRCDVLLLP